MKRLQRWLRAVEYRGRMARHDAARFRAIAGLATATGEAFDRQRQLVFDITFCTNVADCDHV